MAAFDNASLWDAAGLDAIHVAYRNTLGYMAGFGNLNAASTHNTGSGMRRLLMAQSAPLAIPEPVEKPINGDDINYDTFFFGSADPQSGLLEVGQDDNAFSIAADGTTAKAVGIYSFYGQGDSIANPGNFMFLLTRQAHENAQSAGFENELFLNCRVKALGSDNRQFQTEAKFRYKVSFNQSAKLPWAEAISSAMGVSYRRSIKWASLYRCMFHIWIADGSASTTTAFDYAPVDAASTKAWRADTGAALTVNSVSVGGKTATLSAAPPDTTPVILLYQTLSF